MRGQTNLLLLLFVWKACDEY